jgi:hypothetical protein
MSKVYPEAVIYKISTSDNSKVYYGSTNNLKKRKSKHLSSFRNHLKGGSVAYLTAFEILSDPDCKFEIVATLQNISRQELEKIESHYILNNPCVNYNKILGDKVKSRQVSSDKFYQKHKNELKDKSKEYYDQNKNRIAARKTEKIKCECGATCSRNNISQHKNSKKHKDYEASKTINITITNSSNITINSS